ncbi:MAG: rhomboid family intramembrane serine protease [Dehalococcoidales bacterium]|nr:rhomboid family intramembrane serine protease [Dehalococcoidales bacterium]
MNYRSYRNSYQGFSLGVLATLIIANVIVFIGTTINPHLIDLFGLQPSNFLRAPWTIFTSLFLHGGFAHILGNMITLYFFGQFLIDLVGPRNFLITYFAGGILGSIFYLFLGDPNSVAIGASGAIFAVGGALTVLQPNLKVFIFPIPLPISIWIAVIGGFIIMTQPGIAWQAHLGGLVFGLIMGFFLRGPHRLLPRGSRSVYWRGREIQY